MQSMNVSVNEVMKRLQKMNLKSSPNTSPFCSVCQVHVSSGFVMEDHVKGKKHCQLERKQREQASSVEKSIYVRGFPPGSTVDQLTKFFEQFGAVNKVIVDREYGHYAIVEFSEDSTAKSVMSKSSVFMENFRLTIRPRQLKGVQPKRRSRQVHERLIQKQSSALTPTTTTTTSTGIDFEQIKDKMKKCGSLEEEMDLLVSESALSSDDVIIRQNILKELETVLQEDFGEDSQVHMFGSSVNGLGIKGCDLDIFLDLKLEESSSRLSTSSKVDSESGHHNIQAPHDSTAPSTNNSTTCDDSLTCENDTSATSENNDSVTHDNDADADTSVTRKEKRKSFVVRCPKPTQDAIKKISTLLRARKNVYAQIVRVTNARCPVVKFLHLSTSLKCDLSINNRLALRNTSLIQFLLSVDSRIRPLLFSIRQWARVRGLAGQMSAGPQLTNYALTMIVIYYLQTRSPPILPSIDRLSHLAENPCVIDDWNCSFSSDLAKLQPEMNTSQSSESAEEKKPLQELLCGFFEFYARLDFSLKVICLREAKSVELTSFSERMTSDPRLKDFRISPLMVQDPFVLNHNIASNVSEKFLLVLQAEMMEAATICRSQMTSDTSDCPRPSLIPLLSSEPNTHCLDPHLREIPPTVSQRYSTRAGANSFTVRIEKSKLMAEAVRQEKTFAEIQQKWCDNSVKIVRHTLKIFDVQGCLLEQQEEQLACATTEDEAATGHAIHSDADDLHAKSSEVDDGTIQLEDRTSDLANEASSDCETHNKESSSHEGKELCLKESNVCRKRHSAEEDDGKEMKRSKTQQNDSTEGSSEQNSSTENDSISQNRDNSCAEKDSIESVNANDEPRNSDQNQETRSQMTSPVLSAECSTRSRLWIGRKKIRRQQSLHSLSDYEKEVKVSQILSSQLELQNILSLLEFRISLSMEKSPSTAVTVSLEMEDERKSKEFSCFYFSFRSVVEKLVDKYGMEDIADWKLDG